MVLRMTYMDALVRGLEVGRWARQLLLSGPMMTTTTNARPRARQSRGPWRSLAAAVAMSMAIFASNEAQAADGPIAIGEIATPPAVAGATVATLRDAAAAELERLDLSRLARRKIVVSFSVTRAIADKTIACTVNAMLRDARTGVMIAIIEAGAQAEGPGSAEARKEVTHAALRSAVRRIPKALIGN